MLRTERLHNLNRMTIMIMLFLLLGGFNEVKALLQGGRAPARRGGYTQREIAAAANCATGTVSNVQKRMRSSKFRPRLAWAARARVCKWASIWAPITLAMAA